MTCRCTSAAEHSSRESSRMQESIASSAKFYSEEVVRLKAEVQRLSAPIDNSDFEIIDYYPKNLEKPACIMVVVKYNSCPKCAFEGVKVLLYKGITITDILRWRNIDPHFRATPPKNNADAPSPFARFSANEIDSAHAVVDRYNSVRPNVTYRGGEVTLRVNPEEFEKNQVKI